MINCIQQYVTSIIFDLYFKLGYKWKQSKEIYQNIAS